MPSTPWTAPCSTAGSSASRWPATVAPPSRTAAVGRPVGTPAPTAGEAAVPEDAVDRIPDPEVKAEVGQDLVTAGPDLVRLPDLDPVPNLDPLKDRGPSQNQGQDRGPGHDLEVYLGCLMGQSLNPDPRHQLIQHLHRKMELNHREVVNGTKVSI